MDTIKTYPINVEAVTLRTYSISAGRLPAAQTGSVTVKLNTSIVMLPKEPMQPRFADDRVGFFQNSLTEFSDDQQTTDRGAIIQRYRLEPKDPERYRRGQLSEPKNPIIYYIDRQHRRSGYLILKQVSKTGIQHLKLPDSRTL